MKTYVLILSRTFPAKHPRKGEQTNFDTKLLNAVWSAHNMSIGFSQVWMKFHTIRTNYELWSKRFMYIYEGKAALSIRYWTGKPYHSKQTEICKLIKEDGIGLQHAYIEEITKSGSHDMDISLMVVGDHCQDTIVDGKTIAKNDGLSLRDWLPFFNGHNISNPLAIIHFTKFRY